MSRHDIVFQPPTTNRSRALPTLVLWASIMPIGYSFITTGRAKPDRSPLINFRPASARHRSVLATATPVPSQAAKYP
jgi:hypothetical protein